MKKWLLALLLLSFPFALEVNVTPATSLVEDRAYIISAIGLSGSNTINYISGDSTIAEGGTYKLAPQVIVYDGTTKFVGTATNFTGCFNDVKYVDSVPSGGCGIIKVENITSENIKAGVTVSYGLENNTLTSVTGTFTSDANAPSDAIIEGYSAYVNGQKVFGTLRNAASLKSGEAGLSWSYPGIPVIYGIAQQMNTTTDGQAIWSMSVPSEMFMVPLASYLSVKQSDLAYSIGLSSDKLIPGNSILGISSNVGSYGSQTIYPSTSNQYLWGGNYLSGTQTIAGDGDLVAGNIKSGVNIFGVTGNYTGDYSHIEWAANDTNYDETFKLSSGTYKFVATANSGTSCEANRYVVLYKNGTQIAQTGNCSLQADAGAQWEIHSSRSYVNTQFSCSSSDSIRVVSAGGNGNKSGASFAIYKIG